MTKDALIEKAVSAALIERINVHPEASCDPASIRAGAEAAITMLFEDVPNIAMRMEDELGEPSQEFQGIDYEGVIEYPNAHVLKTALAVSLFGGD